MRVKNSNFKKLSVKHVQSKEELSKNSEWVHEAIREGLLMKMVRSLYQERMIKEEVFVDEKGNHEITYTLFVLEPGLEGIGE